MGNLEKDLDILKGKHIVLGISGGIAAYKTVTLLRLLVKNGAEVQVVITPNGKEFITPVTLSSLSGRPVVSEFFTANTGEWHSHVDLGLWADLMVIAPATASTIGKMACGIADNMLVTTYLSAKEHVMVAPAMDLDMWAHPSTARNIRLLQEDGVEIIMPASGELASHLVGRGRMEEPENIFRRIVEWFHKEKPSTESPKSIESMGDLELLDSLGSIEGKKVVITAGPTRERLDPVRYIGNFSTGKMGFALAEEFASRGADVTLIAGPVDLPTPPGVRRIDVESAEEMCEVTLREVEDAKVAVFTAAVADYRPETRSETKIKREKTGDIQLRLVANPDIAAECGKRKRPDQVFIGFALETDNETENAETKLKRKNFDAIVMNSLRDKGAGFAGDTNKVTIFNKYGGCKEYPLKSKREVAADVAYYAEGLMFAQDSEN